jgi:chromosome partitioning protein
MQGKIIAVVNKKGGVGKTTTAINIATVFAIMNKKILLIDLDAQGNSTSGVGAIKNNVVTIYEIFCGTNDISQGIVPTEIPNLSVIPANHDLAVVDTEIAGVNNAQMILKNILSGIKNNYDYIILDCPPSLNMVTINALSCSDEIIIPMICDFFSLEGLSHLLKTVELVQKKLNPQLKVGGILFTMYDKRSKLTEQVEEDVRSCLGSLVYKTVIPRNIKLSEAPSHGKPAIIYDYKCSGSKAYIDLVKEILENHNQDTKNA